MSIIKRRQLLVPTLFTMIFVKITVSACSSEVPLPIGATLSVTPESYSVQPMGSVDEQGDCLFDADLYQDIPLLYQLAAEDGSPIGSASFSIFVEFSGNTFSGNARLQLYQDHNSNGVVDEASELISGEGSAIAVVTTDRWSGAVALILRVNLSCEFTGNVFAYNASAYTQSTINVVDALRTDSE